jgi:hypothetical protein
VRHLGGGRFTAGIFAPPTRLDDGRQRQSHATVTHEVLLRLRACMIRATATDHGERESRRRVLFDGLLEFWPAEYHRP